eukprot:6189829-Pleurochrysis_carterae.AAC.1
MEIPSSLCDRICRLWLAILVSTTFKKFLIDSAPEKSQILCCRKRRSTVQFVMTSHVKHATCSYNLHLEKFENQYSTHDLCSVVSLPGYVRGAHPSRREWGMPPKLSIPTGMLSVH